MNLPRKVRKGENFLVMYDLWNGLVDYLASVRLVAGARITLQKLPSGTVIAAERQTSAPPAAGSSTISGRGCAPPPETSSGSSRAGLQASWSPI